MDGLLNKVTLPDLGRLELPLQLSPYLAVRSFFWGNTTELGPPGCAVHTVHLAHTFSVCSEY